MIALKDTKPMRTCQSKLWRAMMLVMNSSFLLMCLSADLSLFNLNFFLPSDSLAMLPARAFGSLAWLGNTINPGGGALGLADVDMKPLDRNRFACMARACRVCDGSLRCCCDHDAVFVALMLFRAWCCRESMSTFDTHVV